MDVAGGRRTRRNEELRSLYSSLNCVTAVKDGMGGARIAHGDMRNSYRILVGKPKG
jgi:hypothetical protein